MSVDLSNHDARITYIDCSALHRSRIAMSIERSLRPLIRSTRPHAERCHAGAAVTGAGRVVTGAGCARPARARAATDHTNAAPRRASAR
jgi:hypothetical protein